MFKIWGARAVSAKHRQGAVLGLVLSALVWGVACGDDGPGDRIQEFCNKRCEIWSLPKCTEPGFDGEGCPAVCVADQTEYRKRCQAPIDAWHTCALAAEWDCDGYVGCDSEFQQVSCCLDPEQSIC